MAVRNEAFIAIEEALSSQLIRRWGPEAKQIADRIVQAASRNEWDKAAQIAQEADMSKLADAAERPLQSFGIASAVFGAKTLSGDEQTTLSGQGTPKQVNNSVNISKLIIANEGTKALREQLFTMVNQEGQFNFGDASPLERVRFRNKVFEKARGLGEGFSNLTANLHTSRLSVWGFTIEAEVREITRYRVSEVLDSRTCPVCQQMHNREFSVEDARRHSEQALDVNDPNQLKTQFPWPPQTGPGFDQFVEMGEEQLVANAWHVPPYHPGCRGILQKA